MAPTSAACARLLRPVLSAPTYHTTGPTHPGVTVSLSYDGTGVLAVDSGPIISRPRSRQHPVSNHRAHHIPAMVSTCCSLDLLLLYSRHGLKVLLSRFAVVTHKPGELTVVHWPERPACEWERERERERERDINTSIGKEGTETKVS